MTYRPHDALFKAAFEQPDHAGGMFRAVLPAPICAAIAWDTLTPESGSFIDSDLDDSHSDLLFSVKLDDAQAFLYMLLEHQSTNDRYMPLRMLDYLVRIWQRHHKNDDASPLPLIIPIVVTHAPGGWTAPVSFHALFRPDPASIPGVAELTPGFSLILEDINHLSNEDIKQRALAAFPKLALWAMRDSRDVQRLKDNLKAWAGAARAALQTPNGVQAVYQVLKYMTFVSRGELNFKQLRAMLLSHLPEAGDMMLSIAEQLQQEGMEKGLEKGLLQGRLQGQLEAHITHKFGELAPEVASLIAAATQDELTRYLERLPTAETVEAVFAEPT